MLFRSQAAVISASDGFRARTCSTNKSTVNSFEAGNGSGVEVDSTRWDGVSQETKEICGQLLAGEASGVAIDPVVVTELPSSLTTGVTEAAQPPAQIETRERKEICPRAR